MTDNQIQDRFATVLRSCYTKYQHESAAQWVQNWYEKRNMDIPSWIKLEILASHRRFDSFNRKHGAQRRLVPGELSL